MARFVSELTEKDWNRMEKTGIDRKSLTLIFLSGYGKPKPNQRLMNNGYIGLITRRSLVQTPFPDGYSQGEISRLPMRGNRIRMANRISPLKFNHAEIALQSKKYMVNVYSHSDLPSRKLIQGDESK